MLGAQSVDRVLHCSCLWRVASGRRSARKSTNARTAGLRHVLGFIGITQIEFVRAEGLNLGAESKASAIERTQVLIDGGMRKAD